MSKVILIALILLASLQAAPVEARPSRAQQCMTWKVELDAREFYVDETDYVLRTRGCAEDAPGVWVPGASFCERLAFRFARGGWTNDRIFPRMRRAGCEQWDNGQWAVTG